MVQHLALATSQNLQQAFFRLRRPMSVREAGLLAAQLLDKKVIEPFGLGRVVAAVDHQNGAMRVLTQQCTPGLNPCKGDFPL